MKCRAWEDLLQRQLDGESPQALQRHLLACPHCAAQGRTLARFFAGLSHLHPPAPPAGLSDRLTRCLLAEARGRVRSRRIRAFALSGFAAAAALLVTVSLWAWGPLAGKPRDNGVDTPIVQQPDPPPPPLRDSVSRVGDAFASLTQTATDDTVRPTRTLVPVVKGVAEPLAHVPAPVEPQLDKPMREAADGVSNGLSPVTDSARRAVGLFFRDLPGGRGQKPSDKPG